jgi:hypothetical protein
MLNKRNKNGIKVKGLYMRIFTRLARRPGAKNP